MILLNFEKKLNEKNSNLIGFDFVFVWYPL